jgi:polyisoprenyl-teichoic acid--peptidoglycan teichoic acid transferase
LYRFFLIFFIFIFASCSQAKPNEKEIKDTNLKLIRNEQQNSKPIILDKKTKRTILKKNEVEQSLKHEKAEATQMLKRKNIVEKSINFLLIGSDSRGERVSRADTIIIANYNPDNHQFKLISLMRDCYVDIPNYSMERNKLNTAYFLGGKELLKETIKSNFDISIDHTVLVDFQGFVKVIDTLSPEGVTVHVKKDIIDDRKLTFKPGKNTLHGRDLLAYVRFRHDGESDFGRVKRQQEIIITLKDTLQKRLMTLEGFTKIPKIVKDVFKHIETDISLNKMISLSSIMLLPPGEKVETLRIPVKDGYENARFEHSGAVLKLDMPKNKQAIHDFVNPKSD